MQASASSMYADNPPRQTNFTGQPRFSNSPLIQPEKPSGKIVHRSVASGQQPRPQASSSAGCEKSSAGYANLIDTDRIQQFLASAAVLPAIAGLLLFLNHYATVWRWISRLGIIDTIALSCLAFSACLAAPRLFTVVMKALSRLPTAVARLPEMADNIATLSSTAKLVQQDPAPRHWLDMYYNMVSDIDNLLQEMIQLRKLIADMHNDVENGKDKAAWGRKSNKNDRR